MEHKKTTAKNSISPEAKQSEASNDFKDSYFLDDDNIVEATDPKEYIDEP